MALENQTTQQQHHAVYDYSQMTSRSPLEALPNNSNSNYQATNAAVINQDHLMYSNHHYGQENAMHIYPIEKTIAQLPMPPPSTTTISEHRLSSGPLKSQDLHQNGGISSKVITPLPRNMRRSQIGMPSGHVAPTSSPYTSNTVGTVHASTIMTNANASQTAVYTISTGTAVNQDSGNDFSNPHNGFAGNGGPSSKPSLYHHQNTFSQLEQQWNEVMERSGVYPSSSSTPGHDSSLDYYYSESGIFTPPNHGSPNNVTNAKNTDITPPERNASTGWMNSTDTPNRFLRKKRSQQLETPISPKTSNSTASSSIQQQYPWSTELNHASFDETNASFPEPRDSSESFRNGEELRANSMDNMNHEANFLETLTRRRGNSDAHTTSGSLGTLISDRPRSRPQSRSLSEKRPLKALFSSFADRSKSKTANGPLDNMKRFQAQSIDEEEELEVIQARDSFIALASPVSKASSSSTGMLFPYRRSRKSTDDDSSTISSLMKHGGTFFQKNHTDDDGSSISRFRFRGFSQSRNHPSTEDGQASSMHTETFISRDGGSEADLEGYFGAASSRRSSISLSEGFMRPQRMTPFVTPLGLPPEPLVPFFRIKKLDTQSEAPSNTSLVTKLPAYTTPSLRESPLPMRWARATAMSSLHPPPVRSHTMNLVGDRLIVFGGCDDKVCRNDLWSFDVTTWLWTRLNVRGTVPAPRRAHSAAVYRHYLIIFGGGDGPRYFNDVAILDTCRHIWMDNIVVQGDKPSRRRAHSSWTHGTHFYVYAGGDGTQALTDLWQLSGLDTLGTDRCVLKWNQIHTSGNVPLARGYHSSLLHGDRVLLFGGSDARECFDDIHYLDMNTWTWRRVEGAVLPSSEPDSHNQETSGATTAASPQPVVKPMARLSHATVMVGPFMVVLGGHDGVRYSRSIRILDVRCMQWISEPNIHRQWMYYASRSAIKASQTVTPSSTLTAPASKSAPGTPSSSTPKQNQVSQKATVQDDGKENRSPNIGSDQILSRGSPKLTESNLKRELASPSFDDHGDVSNVSEKKPNEKTHGRSRSHSSLISPSEQMNVLATHSKESSPTTPALAKANLPLQAVPPLRTVKVPNTSAANEFSSPSTSNGATRSQTTTPHHSHHHYHHSHGHRQMPSGRGYHTCVVADNRIFFFGGYDGVRVYDDMWTLDLGFRSFMLNLENDAFLVGQDL